MMVRNEQYSFLCNLKSGSHSVAVLALKTSSVLGKPSEFAECLTEDGSPVVRDNRPSNR